MTIPIRENEAWDQADGAPDGPAFDIKVASKTRPEITYRIVRQQDDGNGAGYIIHSPACELWRFSSKRMCRHVREAVYRAEQPANDFMDAVQALRLSGNWWADPHTFGEKVITLLDDARHQREALESAWETDEWRREQAAKPLAARAAEAVSEFDRGDPREAA